MNASKALVIKKAQSLFVMAMVMLISSPAFAGSVAVGGPMQGLSSNLTTILDDFTKFITGPLALGIATIIILVALIGAWFTGGMESFKKALIAVCILGGIVATPALVNGLFSAMGAVL